MQRTTKQLVYGGSYLAAWGLIIFGIYTLTTQFVAPSCTDGIKNQTEEQVDCGGTCQSCALKLLVPVRFGMFSVAPVERGAVALLEIQNPNPAFGAARLSFDVGFYDAAGTELHTAHEESFIYPSEVRSRVILGLPAAAAQATSIRATSTVIRWVEAAQFEQPRVQVRDITNELVPNALRQTVQGIVKNDNAFDLASITIMATLTDDAGRVESASQTLVQDLIPGEERYFQIILPLPEGAAREVREPRLSVEALR